MKYDKENTNRVTVIKFSYLMDEVMEMEQEDIDKLVEIFDPAGQKMINLTEFIEIIENADEVIDRVNQE